MMLIGKTSDRQVGEYMVFPERADTILNRSKHYAVWRLSFHTYRQMNKIARIVAYKNKEIILLLLFFPFALQ